MAANARYTALLDACVLFPASIADALMSISTVGTFSARWTSRIDAEWIAAVAQARPEIPMARLERRRDLMHDAVPDWEVDTAAYEPLMLGLELPDPNDVHVLAAAIAGRCDCIVTMNARDFPDETLKPHGIEVIHPDDFIVYQMDLAPLPILTAFKAMRARLRSPPRSVEEFALALEASQLAATAQRLREAADLI
jgi:hypothetical protein